MTREQQAWALLSGASCLLSARRRARVSRTECFAYNGRNRLVRGFTNSSTPLNARCAAPSGVDLTGAAVANIGSRWPVRNLRGRAEQFVASGDPVISLAPKRKTVGDYANGGVEWQPAVGPNASTSTISSTPGWVRCRCRTTRCRTTRCLHNAGHRGECTSIPAPAAASASRLS